jgi:hypothetical protein
MRGEEVDHNIAIIEDQPAFLRGSFKMPLFMMFLTHTLNGRICQGIQHAITGSGAYYKIISERCDLLDIQENNVLALLFFQ